MDGLEWRCSALQRLPEPCLRFIGTKLKGAAWPVEDEDMADSRDVAMFAGTARYSPLRPRKNVRSAGASGADFNADSALEYDHDNHAAKCIG